jgi:hypothetical protein
LDAIVARSRFATALSARFTSFRSADFIVRCVTCDAEASTGVLAAGAASAAAGTRRADATARAANLFLMLETDS